MAKDYMAASRASMGAANAAENSALAKPAGTRDKDLTKVSKVAKPVMKGITKSNGKRMTRRPENLV